MKRFKKFLLSLAVLLGTAGLASGADNANVTSFADVQAVFSSGGTVKLGADITTTDILIVGNGKTVTLDLNSHELKATGSASTVVRVNEGSTLNIKGPGKLTGGTGYNTGYTRGGAISLGEISTDVAGGTINLDNVEISGNTAAFGAAIYTYGGTASLKNTVIKNNTNSTIYMDGGTLIMEDSSITGNTGSVFLCRNAMIKVKGKTIIYDNLDSSGKQSNLSLFYGEGGGQDSRIEVIGALDADSKIGVNHGNAPNIFSKAGSITNNDPSKFVSDNASYNSISKDSNGNLIFSNGPVATITTSANVTTEYGTLASALSAWSNGSTLTLVKDVTTTSTITVPSGDHTLDLNGYGIKATGNYSVITVSGSGTFTVNDSRPEATTHYFSVSNPASNGAGLATDISDTDKGNQLSFKGGYITGGNANSGGAIVTNSKSNAFLVINGGTIIGNQSTNAGGAIHVSERRNGAPNPDTEDYILCTINGGAVMYNKTTSTSGGWSGGIACDGKFKMTGGTIAKNYSAISPGGVHCHFFYMSDGSIVDNYASDTSCGGGAQADAGAELSGNPEITGNIADGKTMNLWWNTRKLSNLYELKITGALSATAKVGLYKADEGIGIFTLSENTECNTLPNFTSDNENLLIKKNSNGQLEFAVIPLFTVIKSDGTPIDCNTLAEAIAAWTEGSTLRLNKDVSTASSITAPSGSRTLDLNSHELKGNGQQISVIMVNEGSTLNIKGPGKITGGKGDNGDNYTYSRGGAVSLGRVARGGDSRGGTVNIDNVEISGNNANFGAAIWTNGGSVSLKNTVIKNNTNSTIYMDGGTLSMEDSSITGNTGPVFLCKNAMIKVKGKTIIYDNTNSNGQQNNLSLHYGNGGGEDSRIEVVGALDADSKIGVNYGNAPNSFSKAGSTTYNDPSKFVSDNEEYKVIKDDDGNLAFGSPIEPLDAYRYIWTDQKLSGDTPITVTGVTWDETENAAKFNGSGAFIQIKHNVLQKVNSETGCEISFEAKVDSACGQYARFFDINNGTNERYFTLEAGRGSALLCEYRISSLASNSSPEGKKQIYPRNNDAANFAKMQEWHSYTVKVKDGCTSVYMDGTLIDESSNDTIATEVLNNIKTYSKLYLGKSAYPNDPYYKGWIRNLTFFPESQSTVVFESNGGSAVENKSVATGGKITAPANPTKSGVIFEGWYTDTALTKPFDFDTAITEEMTVLYAKWGQPWTITVSGSKLTAKRNGSTTQYTLEVTDRETLEERIAQFCTESGLNITETSLKYGSSASLPSTPGLYTQSVLLPIKAGTVELPGSPWALPLNRKSLVISDSADNTTALSGIGQDEKVDVVISRTFGINYGTLCLPFALTEEEAKDAGLTKIYEVTAASAKDGAPSKFKMKTKKVNKTEAGKSYIVQLSSNLIWTAKAFTGKTIVTTPADTDLTGVKFNGTFAPKTLTAGDKGKLFIQEGGTGFTYPKAGDTTSLKAFRAWFEKK